MIYKIHFRCVINGDVIGRTTYGAYDSIREAAEQISKEVIDFANADRGYFAQFDKVKEWNGELKFNWLSNIDDVDRIAAFRFMWIAEQSCPDKTFIEWYILDESEWQNIDE